MKKMHEQSKGGGATSSRKEIIKGLIKSNLISFGITGLAIAVITVSAIGIGLDSQNVKYRKNNHDQSVKDTIDDLYEDAEECYGYSIGDEITVNGIEFYIIADSPALQDYVVALKATKLTAQEINLYGGSGTANNHVNRYTKTLQGYSTGGMAYYTSETCSFVTGANDTSGCTPEYDESDIKYVVDAWALDKFQNNQLKLVGGYRARLPQKEELRVIGWPNCSISVNCNRQSDTPNWILDKYWTMDRRYSNSNTSLWIVWDGKLAHGSIGESYVYVRPVINVNKSSVERSNNF